MIGLNAVAYEDPLPDPPGKQGRKRKYGKKIKLSKVFQEQEKNFSLIECVVYGHRETIKMLCLDLCWKPIKGKLRFVFTFTSLSPKEIIEIYTRKNEVEENFKGLKEDRTICTTPIFCRTHPKIIIHLFCCVMALMLIRLLWRELSLAKILMNPAQFIDQLKKNQLPRRKYRTPDPWEFEMIPNHKKDANQYQEKLFQNH